jgi:Asp-tRNA(Asn)/Glu-tRNA(Gln) amidotransferase B subunit
MMTKDEQWELMTILIPPEYLGAVIKRVEDGTISQASAKVVLDEVFKTRLDRLAELLARQASHPTDRSNGTQA